MSYFPVRPPDLYAEFQVRVTEHDHDIGKFLVQMQRDFVAALDIDDILGKMQAVVEQQREREMLNVESWYDASGEFDGTEHAAMVKNLNALYAELQDLKHAKSVVSIFIQDLESILSSVKLLDKALRAFAAEQSADFRIAPFMFNELDGVKELMTSWKRILSSHLKEWCEPAIQTLMRAESSMRMIVKDRSNDFDWNTRQTNPPLSPENV